ncbi:BChain B, Structure-specific endonuclease subunit SLX4 [Ceratocystis lukuohia]|uniref:Structure-specific endonuclease subunit SLX4 n=1 Tax=Ceratocystis lukuohia TaxID=2019550 RepID=A0ABR4MS03_9PEZI
MSVPLCNSTRLSSPPPGSPNRTISSSPDGLLTLDEILGSRPKSKTTPEAPIFTSPSKLVLNPAPVNQNVTTISSSPPVQPVGVDADASIIEVGSRVSNPREAQAPRKPRTKKAETERKVANGDSRAKAPRKPRVHKVLTSKPRPAESSDNSVPAKPKRKTPVQRKKTGTMSVYFEDNKKSPTGEAKSAACRAEEAARSSMPSEAILNLEPALPQRGPWAPPLPGVNPNTEALQSNDSTAVRSRTPERPKRTKELFCALDSKIGFLNSIENNPPTTTPAAKVQDPIKKQNLRKSAISKVPTISSVPDTVKAPRRKVSTLTDLAVAQYDNQNVIDLTFMAGYQDPGLVQSEPTNQNQSKKQKRKKKQKPEDPEMVLLSPGTAMKQADGQCFVFGTSSQLVREDSPTGSRDFQLGIDQSNMMAEEEPTGWFDDEVEIQPSRRPKLWNAACRDDDGSTIDLRDSNTSGLHGDTVMSNDDSGYIHSVPEVALPRSSPEKPLVNVQEDSKYPDISIILKTPTKPHHPISTLARPATAEEPSIALLPSLSSSPQLPIRDSPTRKPPVTSPKIETIVESLESAQATFEVPQLDIMSDAQLSRRIAEFGFKNIRKRPDMITLLENCYRSKQNISASSNAVPTSMTSKSSFSTSSFSTASSSTSFSFARSYEASSGPAPTEKYRSRRSSVESIRSITPPTSAQPPLPDSPPLPSKIKRGRGRPRKSPAISSTLESINNIDKTPPKKSREPSSSRIIAIEIPDSDDLDASSPVNLDHESFDGSTMSDNDQLETSFDHGISPNDPPLTVSPAVEEQVMFESISTAVQTAPRTADISNPSWYDRILLYDPIPYEDLTVWLNSGQLERVGYDDEIAPEHVKKWCESRSICCVKRETLKGKKRKRL